MFPLVACVIARTVLRRASGDRVLATCIAATMIGFTLVKLWPPATHACEFVMGALQTPLAASPVTIVRDPTDLVALPFAIACWWLPRSVHDELRHVGAARARSRLRRMRRQPGTHRAAGSH